MSLNLRNFKYLTFFFALFFAQTSLVLATHDQPTRTLSDVCQDALKNRGVLLDQYEHKAKIHVTTVLKKYLKEYPESFTPDVLAGVQELIQNLEKKTASSGKFLLSIHGGMEVTAELQRLTHSLQINHLTTPNDINAELGKIPEITSPEYERLFAIGAHFLNNIVNLLAGENTSAMPNIHRDRLSRRNALKFGLFAHQVLKYTSGKIDVLNNQPIIIGLHATEPHAIQVTKTTHIYYLYIQANDHKMLASWTATSNLP